LAGYLIIADISTHILQLLRNKLIPELIQAPEAISLVSPADKNADYLLGIFLYDIQDMGEFSQTQMIQRGETRKQYPPKALRLRYIIFLNTKAQVASKGEDEQKILSRVMQIIYDNALIFTGKIHGMTDSVDVNATISFQSLSIEEKAKLWTAFTLPLQLGIYLEVSPILLSSTRETEITRVVSTDFIATQKGENDAY
jgi:hypothetical protein